MYCWHCRSRAQILIDECEDREDKKATLELNLSGIGADRFSSRIYDLQHIKRLVLSNNKLTRINPDIKYLIKYVLCIHYFLVTCNLLVCSLEVLDVRKNLIRKIPMEIEEIKGLKVLLVAHNKIEDYPGNVYRLGEN